MPNKQKGLALLMLVFLVALIVTGYVVTSLDATGLKQQQDKNTSSALAEAKAALLSYSAEVITAAPTEAGLTCGFNCPRPGDLPCPDTNNNGIAEASCNTQVSRLGRLPWRTLGVGDLRDGSGERLWYAVSNQYKINTRVLPLNSESVGTITLRGAQGGVIHNTGDDTGLAAVVIAPGEALVRQGELVVQDRTQGAQQLVAQNYLDIAFAEDNADFVDATNNGFISGKVRMGNRIILNDVVLPVTRDDMNAVMEPRVLAEVMQALLYNFCLPGGADLQNRVCAGSIANSYIPDPANINDATCITAVSTDDISNSDCNSDGLVQIGRVPVGGNASAPDGGGWEMKEPNSILRGSSTHNWFQQNGWREMIFYAAAPACKQTTLGCSGAGFLTLQNSLTPLSAPSESDKGVVVISAGPKLSALPRNTANISEYLELEMEDGSMLPPNTYSRYTHNFNRNDRVISVP